MVMKKLNAIIAGVLSLACFIVSPCIIKTTNAEATSAIKLYNEGLNILDANGRFDGWEQSGNVKWAYTSTVKENVPKDDKCAYFTDKEFGDKESITLLNNYSRFPLAAGITYIASINYYATGSATLSIKLVKSLSATLYTQSFKVKAGEWNKLSIEFTPENENENYAKIRFEITDLVGDIYLDDAYFGIVGDAENNLKTDYGAYLRLESDACGIRFRGRIDKSYLDEINADEGKTDISYGIILTKTIPDQIDYTTPETIDSESFTVERLTGYEIPFMLMEAKKIYNTETCEEDGFYGFNCVLVNINSENLKVKFSARTYLKYTENGSIVYEYSDYDEKANARSVEEMVEKAWAEKDIFTDKELLLLQEYRDRLSSLA